MNIKKLEKLTRIYKEQLKLIENLDKAIDEYRDHLSFYKELKSYYYSEEFFKDLDDSNRGDIDDFVDQTILSEDAIYDLISDNYELVLKLLDTTNQIFQDRDI